MKKMWLALALALALPAAPATAEEYTIKVATVAPEGSTWANVLSDFDKELRKRTNGQVKLKIYPGGVQGDERVVLRKIRAGQLQGGAFTGLGIGEFAPSVRVLELPFQYRSYEETDHLHAKLDRVFEAEMERNGYVLLGWAEVGFVYMFSNKKLSSLAEVKAAKPWCWEGEPIATETFKAFGVSPVPLGLPDVLTMLQTGHIDTVYASPSACIALQWHGKLAYMLETPLGNATGAMVVEKRFFDAMPEDLRKITREVGREFAAKFVVATREENERAKKLLVDEYKMELVKWDAKETAGFVGVGAKVGDELAGKLYTKALLDKVRELIDQLRQKKPGAGAGG